RAAAPARGRARPRQAPRRLPGWPPRRGTCAARCRVPARQPCRVLRSVAVAARCPSPARGALQIERPLARRWPRPPATASGVRIPHRARARQFAFSAGRWWRIMGARLALDGRRATDQADGRLAAHPGTGRAQAEEEDAMSQATEAVQVFTIGPEAVASAHVAAVVRSDTQVVLAYVWEKGGETALHS